MRFEYSWVFAHVSVKKTCLTFALSHSKVYRYLGSGREIHSCAGAATEASTQNADMAAIKTTAGWQQSVLFSVTKHTCYGLQCGNVPMTMLFLWWVGCVDGPVSLDTCTWLRTHEVVCGGDVSKQQQKTFNLVMPMSVLRSWCTPLIFWLQSFLLRADQLYDFRCQDVKTIVFVCIVFAVRAPLALQAKRTSAEWQQSFLINFEACMHHMDCNMAATMFFCCGWVSCVVDIS